ncbi:MAG: hypothetical protein AAFS10_22855, partial [Myxococcota bacterium]
MYLSSDIKEALPDGLDAANIDLSITLDGDYTSHVRQLALLRHPGGLLILARSDFMAPFTPWNGRTLPTLQRDGWQSTLTLADASGTAHTFRVNSLALDDLEALLATAELDAIHTPIPQTSTPPSTPAYPTVPLADHTTTTPATTLPTTATPTTIPSATATPTATAFTAAAATQPALSTEKVNPLDTPETHATPPPQPNPHAPWDTSDPPSSHPPPSPTPEPPLLSAPAAAPSPSPNTPPTPSPPTAAAEPDQQGAALQRALATGPDNSGQVAAALQHWPGLNTAQRQRGQALVEALKQLEQEAIDEALFAALDYRSGATHPGEDAILSHLASRFATLGDDEGAALLWFEVDDERGHQSLAASSHDDEDALRSAYHIRVVVWAEDRLETHPDDTEA